MMKTEMMSLKKKTQRMTMTYPACAKQRRGQVQEVLWEGRRRRRRKRRRRSYGVMMMMRVLMTQLILYFHCGYHRDKSVRSDQGHNHFCGSQFAQLYWFRRPAQHRLSRKPEAFQRCRDKVLLLPIIALRAHALGKAGLGTLRYIGTSAF
jgi:hypothetical protein